MSSRKNILRDMNPHLEFFEHDGTASVASSVIPDPDLAAVIASLHRQAHPSQHPEPVMCREEPCRSLPLDALRPP